MPTGLYLHLDGVVVAMRNLEAQWASLGPLSRPTAIVNSVFMGLNALQIPAPRIGLCHQGQGLFNHLTWMLYLNPGLWMGGTTPAEIRLKVAGLGDTVIHESRHCEQRFRVGRLLRDRRIAQGLERDVAANAREIANRLHIRVPAVAMRIAASPRLTHPIEIAEAREWYESTYGSGSSFRIRTVNGIAGYVNGKGSLRATRTAIGDQVQVGAFARYQRALPGESDAYQIAAALTRLYGVPNHEPLHGHGFINRGVAEY
jgi:hypothetical protein